MTVSIACTVVMQILFASQPSIKTSLSKEHMLETFFGVDAHVADNLICEHVDVARYICPADFLELKSQLK